MMDVHFRNRGFYFGFPTEIKLFIQFPDHFLVKPVGSGIIKPGSHRAINRNLLIIGVKQLMIAAVLFFTSLRASCDPFLSNLLMATMSA